MEITVATAGFLLAAYSVVGNDVIQTLGTFLSSNNDKKWWVLWLYSATILACVLIYGWYNYNGDVSYDRLSRFPEFDGPMPWWYLLPPLTLLIITRFGIPVSTTFLILSVFQTSLIADMLIKSVSGYIAAFGAAIVVYLFTARTLEKHFINNPLTEANKFWWTVAQWLSTGFLWSMWLIQDLANVFVYLPRKLDTVTLVFAITCLVSLQALIFYNRGGAIQKVVSSKTNTIDIRSATVIDLLYGIILFFFKNISNIPMSTTWVFIGLLAGREIMVALSLNLRSRKKVFNMVIKDLGKVALGLVISIALVLLITSLRNV